MTIPLTLSQALVAQGLFAKKSLGQHFLLDLNITRKIVRLARLNAGQNVLEIGPGPGGLTQALLEADIRQLVAVEMDERFVAHLTDYFCSYGQRLLVHHGDGLKVNLRTLFSGDAKPAIVANLPYNVGTIMLINWLKNFADWSHLCLMFQLEVCQRITAQVGENHYGRLAILVQSVAEADIVMKLPPSAFIPPPKVDSGVVLITPLAKPFDDLAALETITTAAFAQRRKMLRASLKGLGNVGALLEEAAIGETQRPEELTPGQFQTLARIWRANKSH